MKRIFKKLSGIWMLASLLLLAACGPKSAKVSSAPKTQDQAGIIASCATEAQAASFAKTYGARYRVINGKRKLIEFYDTDEATLKTALPKVRTRDNKVYEEKLVQSSGAEVKSMGDYPFYGGHSPQYRSGDVSRYFPHLRQIQAETLGSSQGEGVVIAVVDTGVYYNHPHISPNIKTNESDPHGNQADGSDGDGNGLADDYAGWDFYNGDAYPIDDHGHGTHVAGLAAGTYAGIAPKAKILPVKVLSSGGRGGLATIAAGILYAIDMGADIVNLSLGGSASGQVSSDVRKLLNSVSVAEDRGSLLIAAAGNGGPDGVGDCNDANPVYPASFDNENVLSVASVDHNNKITSYSNFGGATVDVAAPGGDQTYGGLLSLGLPSCMGPCSSSDQPYAQMMGTSMAAPVVAGVAALVKSARSSLTHLQIKAIIEASGIEQPGLRGIIKSASVVNAREAIADAKTQ